LNVVESKPAWESGPGGVNRFSTADKTVTHECKRQRAGASNDAPSGVAGR
jgi:hypothetical protein